jgi:hypothetical protein
MNLERANSRSFSYSSRSNGSEALICESLRFLVRIIRTNSPERQYHAKSRILILLVFSLTVGLFCSEVPELLSQSDDPSNDSVTLAGPSHVRTVHDFREGTLDLVAAVAGSRCWVPF